MILMKLITALPAGPVDNSTRLELERSFALAKLPSGRPPCPEVFQSIQVSHDAVCFSNGIVTLGASSDVRLRCLKVSCAAASSAGDS